MICLELILNVASEPGEVVRAVLLSDERSDLQSFCVLQLNHGIRHWLIRRIRDLALNRARAGVFAGVLSIETSAQK